jgi:HEAT repeat protein
MNEVLEKKTTRWKALLLGGMLLIAVAGIVSYQIHQDSEFRSRFQTTTRGFKKADVSRLLQVLNDENADHGAEGQKRAAMALGHMGPEAIDAVPALIDKLFHARNTVDVDMIQSIAGALVGIGKAAVPELIKELGKETTDDPGPLQRNRKTRAEGIVHMLGLIGPDAADAVPLLCQRLKSKSLRLRQATTWALAEINGNPSRSVPALISVLNDPEASVRSSAISALATFDPTEEITAALAKRKDDREDVRTAAKEALFTISENATNGDLRSAASKAVTRFPAQTSRSKLIDLRQIGLAMSNFDSTYGQLPIGESNRPTPVRYRDGKRLLSWRVHLLPWLEEDLLFRQFKLDEPWDSPHNIKLLDHMPDFYKSLDYPGLGNKTVVLGLSGPGAIFDPGESGEAPRAVRLRDIPHASAVVLVVMARPERAVPWTAPDEFVFDPKSPRKGLATGSDPILALFTDGSAQSIGSEVSSEKLLQLFQFPFAR